MNQDSGKVSNDANVSKEKREKDFSFSSKEGALSLTAATTRTLKIKLFNAVSLS